MEPDNNNSKYNLEKQCDEWPELGKINSERREVFIFHDAGLKEFIKLILLLFCLAQRPSFHSDTQKRESVVTRLN